MTTSSSSSSDRLIVRSYRPDQDKNFILNSWLKSYRRAPATQFVDGPVFFGEHKELIEKILLDPETTTSVLVLDDEDKNFIVGYMVTNLPRNLIHWVYIKDTFRGLGLTQALAKAAFLNPDRPPDATHMTVAGNTLAKKQDIIYNPYRRY